MTDKQIWSLRKYWWANRAAKRVLVSQPPRVEGEAEEVFVLSSRFWNFFSILRFGRPTKPHVQNFSFLASNFIFFVVTLAPTFPKKFESQLLLDLVSLMFRTKYRKKRWTFQDNVLLWVSVSALKLNLKN